LDTFKELMKMESEVVQMTGNLLSPNEKVYGNLTSGGTESIMLAIYAY
jgi:glutamate/tyrosine decarboxylase-like PLP-dependent enzyme